jgi:peptidoglycan/xylan/chitin deacetylase (PgdA/CDA1 family)
LINRLVKVMILAFVMIFSLTFCMQNNVNSIRVHTSKDMVLLDSSEVLNANMSDNESYSLRKPNESGKIMVVIFHKFVDKFIPTKLDKGTFTTTLEDFRKVLETLYDKGYRLISINDYIHNSIAVPRGYIPIAFTFDDGSEGEFNLINENGKLRANPNTAVGVMEDFYKTHHDFGLKGTFYVNLGLETFKGQGSLSERLKYLIDEGFEIGNHTLTHINLKTEEDETKMIQEIGGEQKMMNQLVPGYNITTLALPYGLSKKELAAPIIKGEYQGTKYENKAIMNIASDIMFPPTDFAYNPMCFRRVMSNGITPADGDLSWWLNKLTYSEQFISDGNVDTITVPLNCLSKVNLDKLQGKQLILGE